MLPTSPSHAKVLARLLMDQQTEGGCWSRKLYINWLKYGEPDNLEVAFLKLCHFGISAGIQLVMMLYAWRL